MNVDDERGLPSTSRYRLLKRVASGGMGAVYLGLQRGAAGFERRVAIKRAHSRVLKDPSSREIILAEARNGSLVRHPNVVSIDDVEEVEGELLLVMDYVDGCSLTQLMASRRALSIGTVLRIVFDACDGLEAIHMARDLEDRPLGLVHRDVSPQNVLIGLDGTARITDFGIAKGVRDPGRTEPTMRRGKFGYMSPEYIKLRVVSASSDIFALGIVLWEALAGRRLFEGSSGLETIRLAEAAVVPSLHAMNARVSPALDAVIQKALAQRPGQRFTTVGDFRDALVAVTQGLVASRAEVAEHVTAARLFQSENDVRSGERLTLIQPLPSIEINMDSLLPPMSFCLREARGAFEEIEINMDSLLPPTSRCLRAVDESGTRELATEEIEVIATIQPPILRSVGRGFEPKPKSTVKRGTVFTALARSRAPLRVAR